MRRLAVALPALVVVAGLYLIASRGGVHRANPTRHDPPSALTPAPVAPAAQSIAVTRTVPPHAAVPQPRTPPHRQARRRPVITAPRTDCRWRRYRDGALGSDRDCAPGALDPAVFGHTARTVCNPTWVASANRALLAPATRERLVIEYQLPGPVTAYVVAHVVPIADGGSPTNPRNLYVLPLNGWGGERTQAVVAGELHNRICEHRLTVAQAARTLEGDWLTKGVPVD